MSKYTNIYGIVVSKDTFDVVDTQGTHYQFSNDVSGFTSFTKKLKTTEVCVMESTGIYHILLANFLYSKKIPVSVVNPLRIKRFAQMQLSRVKTDKADARMICHYGQTQDLELYQPKEEVLVEAKDCMQVMEQLINHQSGLKQKYAGLQSKKAARFVTELVKNQIEALQYQIDTLNQHVEGLLQQHNQEAMSLLCSIPGIGKKTAMLLLIETDDFTNFLSSKSLCSFFGLAPTEKRSGSSINGSRRISKMGNSLVRKKLYMCSLQASRCNQFCKQLYDRLLAKGKAKKQALIAVANKLLKICFGVIKNGLPYDENYKGMKPI